MNADPKWWPRLLHTVAIGQAEELRGFGVGHDVIDPAADLQVPGRPVRVEDREGDCGLNLPVAVLLATGGGGQPDELAVEPEPGGVYLRRPVRADGGQVSVERLLDQVGERLGDHPCCV